jgi:hypothetical protein
LSTPSPGGSCGGRARRRTEGKRYFLALYLQRDKYDATRGSVKTWIAQFAHFKALMRRKYLQTRELANVDELAVFEYELSQT